MFVAAKKDRRSVAAGLAVVTLCIISLALFTCVRATAQTAVEAAKVAAEIDRVAGNLPADSRNIITRLTLLRSQACPQG